MTRQLTAIIEREGDGYVALCPELDIASQGATVAEARENLKEAIGVIFRDGFSHRNSASAARGSVRDEGGDRRWLTHRAYDRGGWMT